VAQPTFILDVEYGLTVRRGTRLRRLSLGDGYEQVVPDGLNSEMRAYNIRTIPLTDAQAAALDQDLSDLQGDFFYSQFKQDDQLYKYRIFPNEWSWECIGPDSNIISFAVKRHFDFRE
jgi:phage-related protein